MKSKSGKRPQLSAQAEALRERGAEYVPSWEKARRETNRFMVQVNNALIPKETPPPSTEGNPSKKE